MFISMVHPNPDKRTTVENILKSKWLAGQIMGVQDAFEEMSNREKFVRWVLNFIMGCGSISNHSVKNS